jgi:hypothetical protein
VTASIESGAGVDTTCFVRRRNGKMIGEKRTLKLDTVMVWWY